MIATLYNTSDDRRVLNKSLTSVASGVECIVKRESSRNYPQLVLSTDFNCNYCYVDGKYYFLTEKKYETGHRVIYNMATDVLMTYKDAIKGSQAIAIRSSRHSENEYIDDSIGYISQNKSTTQAIEFPSGLEENGQFILVTVGG